MSKEKKNRANDKREIVNDNINFRDLTNEDISRLLEELNAYQTELELQNNELRQREYQQNKLIEKYNDLYDSAPVGYLTIDEEMKVVEVNIMGANLLGESKYTIIGKDFTHYIATKSQDDFYHYINYIRENYERKSIEVTFNINNALLSDYQLSGAILYEDHKIYYRIIISDITQLKKYEQQLIEINANLEKTINQRTKELQKEIENHRNTVKELRISQLSLMKERQLLSERVERRTASLQRINSELTLAMKAKDEFLSTMSHELRTPLNAILGLSESLEKQLSEKLTMREKDALQTINQSGQHLLRLINDILDLSKLESGNIELNISKVPLKEVGMTSLMFIKQQALKKNINVVEEIDIETKEIETDSKRLKQILVNLLKNAVKFTPQGGEIGLQIIDDNENEAIKFIVWDTGIGIEEAKQSNLFKPFVQLESGTNRQYDGTGLGLTLVSSITEKLGGSVSIESNRKTGSKFTVALPMFNSAYIRTSDERNILPANGSKKERKTVLLAEDNENNILTLKLQLKHENIDFIIARDGRDAIAACQQNKPDLILMDIQMPVLNGLDAIREIRKLKDMQDLPIVAMTALSTKSDMDDCFNAGANEYITKPVSSKTIRYVINRILRNEDEK